MNLDEMKEVWQAEDPGSAPVPDAEILAAVRRSAAELDRTLGSRDRREIVVAAVVSVLFLPLLWYPSWVARAGVVLYLASSIVTWLKFRRARRTDVPIDRTAPLMDVIGHEREKVGAQIRLLESVLWWYIFPFCLAVILIFGGIDGLTVMTGAYSLAVICLGAFILHLNRAAVRQDLRPRYDHLTRLLDQTGDTP